MRNCSRKSKHRKSKDRQSKDRQSNHRQNNHRQSNYLSLPGSASAALALTRSARPGFSLSNNALSIT